MRVKKTCFSFLNSSNINANLKNLKVEITKSSVYDYTPMNLEFSLDPQSINLATEGSYETQTLYAELKYFQNSLWSHVMFLASHPIDSYFGPLSLAKELKRDSDSNVPSSYLFLASDSMEKISSTLLSAGMSDSTKELINAYLFPKNDKSDHIRLLSSKEIANEIFSLLFHYFEVLLFRPTHPNLQNIFCGQSDLPFVLSLKPENGFAVDVPKIKNLIEKNPCIKAVALMNPNIPTGTVLDRSQILSIIEIAHSNNLTLFIDETESKRIGLDQNFCSFREVLKESGSNMRVPIVIVSSIPSNAADELAMKPYFLQMFNLSQSDLDKIDLLLSTRPSNMLNSIYFLQVATAFLERTRSNSEDLYYEGLCKIKDYEKANTLALQIGHYSIKKHLSEIPLINIVSNRITKMVLLKLYIPKSFREACLRKNVSVEEEIVNTLKDKYELLVIPGSAFGLDAEEGYIVLNFRGLYCSFFFHSLTRIRRFVKSLQKEYDS